MASLKYKSFLFLWKINPLKKQTLDFLKKTTSITNSRKYIDDLYLNNKFKVHFNNVNFYLFNRKNNKSSFDIYMNGLEKGWDRFSLKIWMKLSESSTNIIDVGTNIGLYCISAKIANPNAQVIGFEPSNNSYEVVKKNISINKLDLKIEKIALSNFNGDATFYDLKDDTAVSSLILNSNLEKDNLISYQVNVMNFDDYTVINNIGLVDLISIDVEENEENVLLGMKNTLSNHKPTILVEVLNELLGSKVQNILDNYEYTYYFVNEHGFLLETKDISNRPESFTHSFNVLAVFNPAIKKYIDSNWIQPI